MLSMFSIAAVRSLPIVNAEGSLKVRSVVVPAPAGDGVAGAFVFAVEGAGAGAAGAAGVCTVAGAGVEGAALLEEPAGAGFGCLFVSVWQGSDQLIACGKRAFETMHTMKPFSSIL